ncbi:hypothetical protein ACQEVB_03340 [Pseudonocardia sp. CA-107938]|uniref:hypothetical protein n=1 Tax=Pseudonocardia sp. CA-107938 TaxID=3240021 RepID=UPI003D8D8918
MTAYHFLGSPALAEAFGVHPEAVATWRKRYPAGSPHAFPEPDVDIDGDPGWAPERLPEILDWRARLPRRTEEVFPLVSQGAYLEAATDRGLYLYEATNLLRALAEERPDLGEQELAGWIVDRWS